MPTTLTVSERSRSRGADGRFCGGNAAATDRGVKAAIKRQLGKGATGAEVEELYRETLIVFRGILKTLPDDSATVQGLAARQARSEVLSAHYAACAAGHGLDSDAGRQAMELSIKLDARAERLAVTSLTLAAKLGKARQGIRAAEEQRERWAAQQARTAALTAAQEEQARLAREAREAAQVAP